MAWESPVASCVGWTPILVLIQIALATRIGHCGPSLWGEQMSIYYPVLKNYRKKYTKYNIDVSIHANGVTIWHR
jgi:hypothetical protein